MDGSESEEVSVKSGVPQGTVLGLLLFLLYINDINDGVGATARLFADDCLMHAEIRSREDAETLQSDLNKVVEWSNTWQMS